jgi:hypothetical protein
VVEHDCEKENLLAGSVSAATYLAQTSLFIFKIVPKSKSTQKHSLSIYYKRCDSKSKIRKRFQNDFVANFEANVMELLQKLS